MPNLFLELKALLPDSPLYKGEVLAVHSDNTSTVELVDGNQVRVRGSLAAVGTSVFIRDGIIESVAPSTVVVRYDV